MNISELRRKGFEISFYTSVPKIMIMFYCSWDMACVRCNCYFPFWAFFSPFTPLTAQKMKISQKSKKKKKTPGGINIYHKCTKNHDHMLYCYWDMVCDRCNCHFSFWSISYPFTPLTASKMNISRQWKKCLEVSSFYTSVSKLMIICYTVPKIWCVRDVILIFYFGLFFIFLAP